MGGVLLGTGDHLINMLLCFVQRGGEKREGALCGCVLTPSLLSRRPAQGAKFLSVAVCEINLCVV